MAFSYEREEWSREQNLKPEKCGDDKEVKELQISSQIPKLLFSVL